MNLREAYILTLRVLKQVMENKLDHNNVQLAQARMASALRSIFLPSQFQVTLEGFHILDEKELKEHIDAM